MVQPGINIIFCLSVWPLCKDDEFRCDNNQCLPTKYRCDLVEDCEDGSDEINCGLYRF
jgi:hypothetical protein